MKAIYINFDPYLQAFADWLNAGKPGPAPSFDPLPLAVTIPLGETPCIYLPAQSAENPAGKIAQDDPGADWDTVDVVIDGETITVATDPVSSGDLIDSALVPGLSSLAPAMKYAAAKFTGDSVKIYLKGAGETSDHEIPFTVLVRRETASGPVDLVDFTPPAAAPSAADIKSALVAAGPGALAGVSLSGSIIVTSSSEDPPTLVNNGGETPKTLEPGGDPTLGVGS